MIVDQSIGISTESGNDLMAILRIIVLAKQDVAVQQFGRT
jgi:hypothetical protein